MPDPSSSALPDPAAHIAELQEALARAKRETQEALDAHRAQDRARKVAHAAAQSIDPDTVQLLIERAVGNAADADLDGAIAAAASELRRRKPFLFAATSGSSHAAPSPAGPDNPAQEAFRRAAESGHPRDLLTYMRLRRA